MVIFKLGIIGVHIDWFANWITYRNKRGNNLSTVVTVNVYKYNYNHIDLDWKGKKLLFYIPRWNAIVILQVWNFKENLWSTENIIYVVITCRLCRDKASMTVGFHINIHKLNRDELCDADFSIWFEKSFSFNLNFTSI